MNIDDVKMEASGSENALCEIFQRQQELMMKYHSIEKGNGLLVTDKVPVDLHEAAGQYRLKDFAWRITEEIGEALEAFEIHPDYPQHFDEEMADALHFLTEFTILSGVTAEELVKLATGSTSEIEGLVLLYIQADVKPIPYSDHSNQFIAVLGRHYSSLALMTGVFIESLAKTCNTLKNKPWKQTQMMTDVDYFKKNLAETWIRFIQICQVAQIKPAYLYDLYSKKNTVNQFRQRSNY